MASKASALWSTLGKKVLMAVTGIAMVGFLIGHLAGNFLLLTGDPDPYNAYSDFLIGLGWGLIVIELVLVAFFLVHVAAAVSVTRANRASRPGRYQRYRSAGEPSKQNVASRTMIWTGVVLFVFTVLHLYTFKYGPGEAEGYVSVIDGEQVRDLYRLVIEVFSNPWYVLWYVAAMAFMGFHLRHGFWSGFQSLGLHHPQYTRLIQVAGILLAIVLGVGFLLIPVWIYFLGGAA